MMMLKPRSSSSRWYRPAVAAVAFAFLLACGSGGSGESNSGSNPGGGVGAPVGEPNPKGARGSPIDIPAINNSQGQPVNEVREQLEQKLRRLCGNGELCVTIKAREGDNDIFTVCQFDTTDPRPGTAVERQSTVYLVTGARRPCNQPS